MLHYIIMGKKDLKKIIPLLFYAIIVQISAQQLYIGNGGMVLVNQGTLFTTSNNLISHHASGVFAVEAGFDWTTASATEYVNGSVSVLGTGTTIVHVGNKGSYSPMTVATASADDNFVFSYTKSKPIVATVNPTLVDYQLSDTEYWSVAKTTGTSTGVIVSGLTADAGATYGSNPSSGTSKVVHLNTTWNEYTGTSLPGDFAYASFINTLLGLEDLDLVEFSLYPNPVVANGNVRFVIPENEQVAVYIYDITGKLVWQQNNGNAFRLNKAAGVYIVKFVANGKTSIKRLLVK